MDVAPAVNALAALAILSAIPVVSLALWADSFGRGIERQSEGTPRLAGVVALIVQFSLFMATTGLRRQAPVAGYACFLVAVFLQIRIQMAAERKLRGAEFEALLPNGARATPPSPITTGANDMGIALRAFFWATFGGALYVSAFALPVLATALATKALRLSPAQASFALIASAVAGMMAGLAVNFALAPLYLRKVLPVRPMGDATDGRTRALLPRLEGCFSNAGLAPPALWIIDSPDAGRAREATAMIAGFPSGKGWFRPALFISRGMLEALTDDETVAVALHEVAHVRLRHLRRRFLYSGALIFGTTAAATFLVFLASLAAPEGELKNLVGYGAAAGAFLLTFKRLGAQSRGQEIEADLHSVASLGGDPGALAAALRKLDAANGQKTGYTHPATDARVKALETWSSAHGAGKPPAEAHPAQSDRAA